MLHHEILNRGSDWLVILLFLALLLLLLSLLVLIVRDSGRFEKAPDSFIKKQRWLPFLEKQFNVFIARCGVTSLRYCEYGFWQVSLKRSANDARILIESLNKISVTGERAGL